VVLKRYSEFESLHNALKVHFSDASLPDLPPKYTTFGTTTTVASRDRGFQEYLQQLLRVPDILDCVEFRKFIKWKSFSAFLPLQPQSQLNSVYLNIHY
jgi:hypothetical protein